MKHESKLMETTVPMTAPEPVAINETLYQLVHDVHGCLHVIGLGTELLKSARDDDARFAEVCAGIDHERREAVRLLNEYLRSTREE